MSTGVLDLQISKEVVARACKVKVILMDVDGVMTDGRLYYLPGPEGAMVEMKGFNTQDGLGLHFCHQVGIQTGVISGRNSPGTVERCRMLNMKYVYQGLLDKIETFNDILADAGVRDDEAVFIGDDFTDVPLILRSGLGVAVANAREEVKRSAHYTTVANGGEGAVREVIEIVLKARGLWPQVLEKYMISPDAVS
jgi:3-deoxy-D-manno-octulosonate 8-phosphate phosphatase (KDO 8-P phosphatase)